MGEPKKFIVAGTRVKVKSPGDVPPGSVCDPDGHRVSTTVKRRLQRLFYKGDRRVTGTVVYVGSELERERLRRSGQVKVEVRDATGASVVFTVGVGDLQAP